MPAAKRATPAPAVKAVADIASKRSPVLGTAVVIGGAVLAPLWNAAASEENLKKLWSMTGGKVRGGKDDPIEAALKTLDIIEAVVSQNPNGVFSDAQAEVWKTRIERLRLSATLARPADKKQRRVAVRKLDAQVETLRAEVHSAVDVTAGPQSQWTASDLSPKARPRVLSRHDARSEHQ